MDRHASKPIIAPVPKKILARELSKAVFVRETKNGGNRVFAFHAMDAPLLMREVGRLRELTFRQAGGGTGEVLDMDEFDSRRNGYRQLIVWDPDAGKILGGYRYKVCDHNTIDAQGDVRLSSASLFHFSEKFRSQYLPHMIELGRSFVQPAYQSTGRLRKGIYALDNLWDGLGALVVNHPKKKYFFGKVTMYRRYNMVARDILLHFLWKYFACADMLVRPIEPIETKLRQAELEGILTGKEYREDYKVLSKSVRRLGEKIPPLINSYMKLSPTMKVFGTAMNRQFGNVEETAIMVTIADIYEHKIQRHIPAIDPA